MSRNKRGLGKHPLQMVPVEQMIPAEPIIQELTLVEAEPVVEADGTWTLMAEMETKQTGYWQRALGEPPVSPPVAVPIPATPRNRSVTTRRPSAERASASYWDRARGAAARRPMLPELREHPAPQDAMATSVDHVSFAATNAVTGVVARTPVADSEASLDLPTAGLEANPTSPTEPEHMGAHARDDHELADEVRGAHVKADDPIAGTVEPSQAGEDALSDVVRGAHVKADDPLAGDVGASHRLRDGKGPF